MILNIPIIASCIEMAFERKKCDHDEEVIGKFFGVQSKSTFLVKLLDDRKK